MSDFQSRPVLELRYSCSACGLTLKPFSVRERYPDEDIRDWLDFVSVKLSRDHHEISPDCASSVLSEVFTPLRGDPEKDSSIRIGEALRQ